MVKRAHRILCLIIISLMMISNVALADELALPSSSADFSVDFAKYMLMLATGHTQDKTAAVLQGEGFDILVQNNYDKSDNDPSHTCAYTIGVRNVQINGGTRPLILCVVRGTNAGEWYSNFDFAPSHSGETSFAENFLFAANDVFLTLTNVIDVYDSPIVLVTGHSRGAACANLLGVLLNARYDSDDIYVYTFATPNTLREHLDDCDNIFNVINPCDLVTMMPLGDWGYMRAGHDVTISGDTELAEKETNALSALVRLAPDIPAYYSIRHSLTGPGESDDGMTTFEMMLMLASGISQDTDANVETEQSNAIAADSDFSELMNLLGKLSGSWSENDVLKQHLPQTYLDLLNQYNAEG